MVDYGRALKRPFGDLGILAIGTIVSVIPIVNFLAMGYYVKLIQATMKKDYKMPAWGDWANLFVKGIFVTIAGLVYMLPAIAMLGAGIGSVVAGGIMSFATDPTLLFSALAGAGIFFVLFLLFALLAAYLLPAAVVGYAKAGEFGAFFDIGTVASKAFRVNYLIVWAVTVFLAVVVVMALSLIPVIGTALGSFVTGVAMYTAFAEVYME